MWVVVVFLKENSIAVVPKCWLMKDNTICTWPPVPNVKKHVLKRIEPEANWQIFGVRVLGHGKTYDNYLKARNAAQVAEETSDINSETEYGKQKRKRKSKCISSSDSDSCLSDENDHINNNSNDSPYPSMPSVFLSSKSAEFSRGTTLVLTKTSHHRDFGNSTPSVFLSNKSAESSSGTTPVRAKNSHDRDFENSLLVPSTPNTENNNEPKDLLHRINRQYSIITFKLKNLENDIAGIMKHL